MAKSQFDWVTIKAEWELGQLSLGEIARQHGMSDHSTISKRAKRYGWPPRPEVMEVVTSIVPTSNREGSAGTNTPRMALMAFDRVIRLLHRHRKLLGSIFDEIATCMDDIAKHRAKYGRDDHEMPLYETDAIATIIAKVSQAIGRLVPLERRAFGLNDQEGPSEFDALTTEQLEALGEMVRQRLGTTGVIEAEATVVADDKAA